MDQIVLLNKIKSLLAENCEGTNPSLGLDRADGLSLSYICDTLYEDEQEDIELLLKLETQTFYYDHHCSRWKMFPKIVDIINEQVQNREARMKHVWNNTNISHFISYDDYYEILLLRKNDFETILDRCIKIGSCNPKILRLPPYEIWNTIRFASDKEFEIRFAFMKMNAPDILADKKIFYITLAAYAYAENRMKIYVDDDDNDYDDTEDFDEDDDDFKDDNDEDIKEYNRNSNNTNYNYHYDYNYDGDLDTSSWNLESVLRQEGYTVSQKENLSDYERQQILLSVLNRNLMSRWQIIEHIELQISLRKNNRMYDIAVSKWERDLLFLRRLT